MRWIALLLVLGILIAGMACEDEDAATDDDIIPTLAEPTDTQPPPPTDTPASPRATPIDGGTTNGVDGSDNCHPSYEGACLLQGIGDYDCAGGSGNGPNYTGRVRVVGPDVFDLDRNNDGIGCE